MDAFPPMRTELEIQRAHDLLAGIMLGDAPVPPGFSRNVIDLAASVLCWCLRHDHSNRFELFMQAIEQDLQRLGFGLREDKPDA